MFLNRLEQDESRWCSCHTQAKSFAYHVGCMCGVLERLKHVWKDETISKCKAFQGRIGRPKAVQYLEQTKLHMWLFLLCSSSLPNAFLHILQVKALCAVSASDMLSIHLPGRVDAVWSQVYVHTSFPSWALAPYQGPKPPWNYKAYLASFSCGVVVSC